MMVIEEGTRRMMVIERGFSGNSEGITGFENGNQQG